MIQSCLRDQFQAPVTILMNNTATVTGNRAKRDSEPIEERASEVSFHIGSLYLLALITNLTYLFLFSL